VVDVGDVEMPSGDTANTQFGALVGHGTPMRRLIESGAARGTGSSRSGCGATGPSPRPSSGWPSRACAATR
jgi:agmatinase